MTLRSAFLLACCPLAGWLATAGCSDSKAVTSAPGNNNDEPDAAPPPTVGINDRCDRSHPCRDGLVCDDSDVCEAEHSLVEGHPCTLGAECLEVDHVPTPTRLRPRRKYHRRKGRQMAASGN